MSQVSDGDARNPGYRHPATKLSRNCALVELLIGMCTASKDETRALTLAATELVEQHSSFRIDEH
jgi:hypothetical protein